jgi:hypothetical protein
MNMARTTISTLVLALGVLGFAHRAAAQACTATAGTDAFGNPTLLVTGTATKQILTLSVDLGQAAVALDCNGDGDTADPSDIVNNFPAAVSFDIQLKGSDTINFNVQPAAYTTIRWNPQITLGAGLNSVNINAGSATLQTNSKFLIDLLGVAGTDTVTVNMPVVSASSFRFRADTGPGNDVVTLNQAAIASGSNVAIDVALGLGNNTFTMNHSANILQANLTVSVEGGSGGDTVNSNWTASNTALSEIYYSADLGAGSDKFTAFLDMGTFDFYGGSQVHFDVSGGTGNNQLQLTRAGTTPGGFASAFFLYQGSLLDIRLKGGPQTDTLAVDLAGGGIDPASTGTLRIRADGGGGNDTLNLAVDCSTNFGGENPIYDVLMNGGVGNDKVNWTLNNGGCPNAAGNYAPTGTVLLEGLTGNDTCVSAGNGLVGERGCEL